MGKNTRELDLQNDSVTTDPLLGDVQFDHVVTPEQHQFNGPVQTIYWDSLIYSTGMAIKVSGFNLTMVKNFDHLREQVFRWCRDTYRLYIS